MIIYKKYRTKKRGGQTYHVRRMGWLGKRNYNTHPSDKEAIQDLRRVAVIIGKPPTMKEYDELGRYSSSAGRFWQQQLTTQ